jgi:hypothetical protein
VTDTFAPGYLGFGVSGRDLGKQPPDVLLGGFRIQVDQSA